MFKRTKPIFCKTCNGHVICDFCAYYDFNGNEEGCYIDKGYCNRHKKHKDPYDGCNQFICFNTTIGKIVRLIQKIK